MNGIQTAALSIDGCLSVSDTYPSKIFMTRSLMYGYSSQQCCVKDHSPIFYFEIKAISGQKSGNNKNKQCFS